VRLEKMGASYLVTAGPIGEGHAGRDGDTRRMSRFLNTQWNRPRALAWLLAVLLFAELSSRLLSGVFVLSIDNLVARELSPLQWANGPLIYDDKLGWRLKPRFQAPGQGRPDGKLSVGALGLRGGAYQESRVPRQAVLAIGESLTLGINVDDSETWPARLGGLLKEPVLNGSAWSWGLDQIVLRAEELVPVLRPTTLLLATRPESVAETDFKTFGLGYKPYFDVIDGRLILAGSPVPKMGSRAGDIGVPQSVLGYSHIVNSLMRTRVGYWISMRVLGANWVDYSRLTQRAHVTDESSQIACLLMERLADLKDRYGMRVVVMMAYSAGELLTPRASEEVPPVLGCAQARGLEALDSYQALRALAANNPAGFKRLWQQQGDIYGPPSPEGNDFMAALVQKALASSALPPVDAKM